MAYSSQSRSLDMDAEMSRFEQEIARAASLSGPATYKAAPISMHFIPHQIKRSQPIPAIASAGQALPQRPAIISSTPSVPYVSSGATIRQPPLPPSFSGATPPTLPSNVGASISPAYAPPNLTVSIKFDCATKGKLF